MKKTLQLLVLFLFLSVFAYGQKVEFGIDEGMVYNKSFYLTNADGTTQYKGNTPAILSICTAININPKWQMGMNISVYESSSTSLQYTIISEAWWSDTLSKETDHTASVMANLYITRKIRFFNSDFYVGACAGPIYSVLTSNSYNYYLAEEQDHHYKNYGYSLGIMLGYTYYFNKKIGADFHVLPAFNSVKYNLSQYLGFYDIYKASGILMPCTVGIRYRL
jgi:hypothetical protein